MNKKDKALMDKIKRHYFVCFECAKKSGGNMPPNRICTVSTGKCKLCGEEEITLFPWVDFNWEKDPKNDFIAKVNRD